VKKILIAVALGAVLGVLDGSSAWFTPDARPQLGNIILWSAMKDVMAGFLIGVFAVFVKDWKAVAAFGLLVGLALALWVASVPDPETGKHYYLAIMLPGSMVGLLVGYFTAKYGARSMGQASVAEASQS
jgi:flagellar biosynthesis protein FliR